MLLVARAAVVAQQWIRRLLRKRKINSYCDVIVEINVNKVIEKYMVTIAPL